MPQQKCDINEIKNRAENPTGQHHRVKGDDTHQDRRRESSYPLRKGKRKRCVLHAVSFQEQTDKQNGHQQILQKCRVFSRHHETKFHDENDLKCRTANKYEKTVRHKKLTIDLLREFLFAEFEIGIKHHAVEAHPEHVDDLLCDQHTCHPSVSTEKQIGIGIDRLPRDIQCQCPEWHGIGLLLETEPYAFFIDDDPADA